MSDKLEQAIAMIKAGRKEDGRYALKQLLQTNPQSEKAWLWLAGVTNTDAERHECLKRVLTINPENRWAKKGLLNLNKPQPAPVRSGQVEQPREIRPKVKDQLIQPYPSVEETLAKNSIDAPVNMLQLPPDVGLRPPQSENDSAPPVKTTVVLDNENLDTGPAPETAHPTGTYDAFISYSRKDKPFVQHLYETLLNDERKVWIDWGNIPVTADWRKEIREGIERADTIIFVMSPNFLASRECMIELEQAEAFNKRLIPLVYRDVDTSQVPQSLGTLNWLFFRQVDDFDTSFQALREGIDTDLDWVKEHTRLLVRATEWDESGRNTSFLLQGDDLKDAELKAAQADKNPSPTPLQKQYILASRQDATHRQGMMMVRITIGLVISIILAIFALVQYQRANSAQQVAEMQRDEAALQASIALSRQLGAEAIIFADSQPDLAALLSLEASRIVNMNEITGELLASLKKSPYLMRLLHGHTANVRTVAFNSAGTIMASGGKDQTIVLWNTATNEPLGPPLVGHSNRVGQVVFSPDGKILASGSRDNTIRLWNVETHQPLGEPLTGHTDWVNGLAFSPDGATLISGSGDGSIILWDVASRQPLGLPLTGHASHINAIALSPDGEILASGSEDRTVILWDVTTRQSLSSPLTGHTGWVNSLAFSPDGQTLASGSSDRTIRLWDVTTGEIQGVPFTGHPTAITSIVFSPDGQVLVSGSEDDAIILWDVQSGQQLGWPLRGHANSVLGLAFNPNNNILASASSDATLALWDMSAAQFMVGHTSVVRDVAFSPDGQTIASGSSDNTVRLWNAATLRQIGEPLTEHSNTVIDVAFSPDGKLLASGGRDETIILREAATGIPIGSPLTGHQSDIWGLVFSPDSRMLASANNDKTVKLWDIETREIVKVFEGHTSSVNQTAFSPDGKLIASAGSDKQVMIWDVATGQPLFKPLVGHVDGVNSVVFSPGGQLLASGGDDGFIILWDVGNGKEAGRLLGHVNRVTSVAFSPDGKSLASGSYDKNILVWDVSSRLPYGPPLLGHTNDVNSIAWHPNGEALVSGSWDDTLILWKIDFTPWSERACQIANRNLSAREWEEFIGPNHLYHATCIEQ